MTSTYLIFTGLLNSFLLVWLFIYFLILLLISSGLLICMENTFWNINRDASNFVKLFKESFTLYVESGMREMTERDIEMLRNENGEFLDQEEDFNAKFCKFIFDHYLRKFHCFYLYSTHLITVFIYWIQPTRNPWPERAKHWDERLKKSLQGFMLKFHRKKRAWWGLDFSRFGLYWYPCLRPCFIQTIYEKANYTLPWKNSMTVSPWASSNL